MDLIKGDAFKDSRGLIRFVNDFQFEGIKRFYTIYQEDTETIRAWQGHKLESKYFYVIKGSFLINWVKIDNWENPARDLQVESRILSDKESELLIVGPGHANGFKALEENAVITVFSDMTLEESKKDDYRFPADYWKMIF